MMLLHVCVDICISRLLSLILPCENLNSSAKRRLFFLEYKPSIVLKNSVSTIMLKHVHGAEGMQSQASSL